MTTDEIDHVSEPESARGRPQVEDAEGKPFLSVVIPCYNAEGTVRETMGALVGQQATEPWEVVVADNASTDDSIAIVESYRDRLPCLRIVDASERKGQPYALNTGAKAARGTALVFYDADDVAAPGWLQAIETALKDHAFVASRHMADALNPAWAVRARGRGQEEELRGIWYPPHLPHAGGCGLGMRRSLFEEVGGFDESLPYLHDTDICWKLIKRGHELELVHDAVIHIRYRTDLSSIFRQAWSWGFFNVILYTRHCPEGEELVDTWPRYFRRWWRLLRRSRALHRKESRARLAWRAGHLLGILKGSLAFRVPPIV